MLEGQVETQFGRMRLGKNQYQGHTLLKNHDKTRSFFFFFFFFFFYDFLDKKKKKKNDKTRSPRL